MYLSGLCDMLRQNRNPDESLMTPAKTIAATAVIAPVFLLAACMPEPKEGGGRADYLTYCASCHGADGTGDPDAATPQLAQRMNLTTIAQRNGGEFPRLQVMGKIYGYTMGSSDREMPAFGDLLEGRSVMYDAGDGIPTQTPVRLVNLAQYLESIQAR